ncbi:MAG: IS1634 family transposase [Clostridiales bacterium]|nr:IS1634 family transposase [Clostridiales bacterium]
MNIDSTRYGDDRFYRVSDKLLKNQSHIETALYKKESDMFYLEDSVFLYDLTNTYFEGQCELNPKAEYGGHQKEKRNDCPQVVVALIVDTKGFIRRHRMFNGKMNDVKSLSYILKELEEEFEGRELPTFIFDRGVVSEGNLELLKNYKYIVASRTNEEMEFVEEFENGEFTALPGRDEKKKSQIKVLLKEHNDLQYLLCKSSGRKQKEAAMRNKQELKLEEELNNLAKQVKKARDRDVSEIERKVGRLKERYSRVAKYYWFKYDPCKFELKFPAEQLNSRLHRSLELLVKKFNKGDISYNQLYANLKSREEKYPEDFARHEIKLTEPVLKWGTNDEKTSQAEQLEGNYLIKTNRKDLKADEIWNIYVMLTRVEKAFRDLKTHLGLRPNYHQLEDRVDGHIFISILAYHLMHTIEYVMRQQGISSSWASIKRLVSTHAYATIQLPIAGKSTINLRKPGIVEGIHETIYRKLKVDYRNLPIRKTVVK